MRKFVPVALVPLAVAACAGPTPPRETVASTGGSAFTQALAQEYQQYAQSEYLQLDWPDQAFFRDKAKVAAQGFPPAPEDPTRRAVGTGIQIHPDVDYGNTQRAEAIQERQRLLTALAGDAPRRNPQAAARAQVAYDCWVEQLEEGWQKDDIDRCRTAYRTAMGQLEARPVAQLPPPQMPAEVERFQVYFPFDSAQLTPSGQRVIAAAAEDIRRENATQVEVTGHADRAGDDDYNRRLSAQRAQAVKQVLVAQGIPADRIETQARGERDPVVPTPDDVRQPQNRRAVIDYD
ncbi:MAG: OmpA family protein [Pseudomonadota bacterium]